MKKSKATTWERAAYWLIGIGLGLVLILTVLFLSSTTPLRWSATLDTNVWNNYGTILSGTVGIIFSMVGVVFLIVNLREQRLNGARQQIESRFFQLLQIHRSNVAEMQSKGQTAHAVFIAIKDEMRDVHEEIDKRSTHPTLPSSIHPDEPRYFGDSDAINTAWLIVYFGLDNSSSIHLNDLIKKVVADPTGQGEVFAAIDRLKTNPKADNTLSQTCGNKRAATRYKQYDGHQSRLGHYFRHLYQTVRYIDEQPTSLLSYTEKYDYIKTLRAQLSTHEQAIFFYNSLSELGKAWEKGEADPNCQLITKYNLIKNLPANFTAGLQPYAAEAYPNIHYEHQSVEPPARAALVEGYEKQRIKNR